MKASEKKMLVKHLKKDDKEFRDQIKEDVKLKKQILKPSAPVKEKASMKERKHEAKESKAYERKEDKKESMKKKK